MPPKAGDKGKGKQADAPAVLPLLERMFPVWVDAAPAGDKESQSQGGWQCLTLPTVLAPAARVLCVGMHFRPSTMPTSQQWLMLCARQHTLHA